MDLRGFSHRQQRLPVRAAASSPSTGRLERTLFVVDGTTDVELLRATLTQAAAAGGAQGAPALHSVHASGPSSLELGRILGSLSALSAA